MYADSHQFVAEQRTDQYNHLLYAVEKLRLVDMKAPRGEILLAMWLLEIEETEAPKFPESGCNVSMNYFCLKKLFHYVITAFNLVILIEQS